MKRWRDRRNSEERMNAKRERKNKFEMMSGGTGVKKDK